MRRVRALSNDDTPLPRACNGAARNAINPIGRSKVVGEHKAKLISRPAYGRGTEKINLYRCRNVPGSAIGGAGSPAIARTRKRVPRCDR